MRYFKSVMAFFLMFVLASGFVLAGAREERVKVLRATGRVEFLPSGKADWKALEAGRVLYSGDSVKTYRNSFAEIAFDRKKDNMVRINPDSYVVLKLKNREKIERDIMKLFPKKNWFEVTNLLIAHGRNICVARKPKCARCAVNNLCPSAFMFS